MRKILSLILGLLWTLPSWAGTSSDYTKLEYIESTGTQYIDTGYKFSAGNKFEVVLNPLNNIQQGWFFGANSSGGEVLFSNGSIYFGAFRPSTASTSGLFPTTNTIYKITGDMRDASSNQSSLLIDDNLIWQGTGTFNGRKIYLFAYIANATNESSLARPKIRIYGFKIWQNDTIVQDLIPVKRHSDGVICMYDMVTGEFFENIGTGTFVAGPVAEIKIATTKYNETVFRPLNTALQNAISVVDTVVSNTITQAGRIATLQTQKQTRPDETCPAGKKCLLVEDASGVPHWYEIVENAWSTDYTKLQYISSSGTQWIDTGYVLQSDDITFEWTAIDRSNGNSSLFGSEVYSTPKYSIILYGSSTSRALYIANSSAMGVGYASGDSSFHSWVLSVTSDHKVTLSKDGVRVGGGDWIGDIQKQKSIGIFENNHQSQISTLTLKSFSITDGGVLVRNMIPMKRKIDDAVGLYDTVNNRFYTNAGTGEFIAGDPVVE